MCSKRLESMVTFKDMSEPMLLCEKRIFSYLTCLWAGLFIHAAYPCAAEDDGSIAWVLGVGEVECVGLPRVAVSGRGDDKLHSP